LPGLSGHAAALFVEARTLREFYFDTASLAPGAEIRPMGVTFHLGLVEVGGVIFAFLFSLIGVLLSFRNRRWLLLGMALLPFMLALSTIPIGDWGFNHVLELRKLVLEE
jgi:hypothetical protein